MYCMNIYKYNSSCEQVHEYQIQSFDSVRKGVSVFCSVIAAGQKLFFIQVMQGHRALKRFPDRRGMKNLCPGRVGLLITLFDFISDPLC